MELGKNQPEEECRMLGEILVNRDNVVDGSETYKDFMAQYIYDCKPFSKEEFSSANFLKV